MAAWRRRIKLVPVAIVLSFVLGYLSGVVSVLEGPFSRSASSVDCLHTRGETGGLGASSAGIRVSPTCGHSSNVSDVDGEDCFFQQLVEGCPCVTGVDHDDGFGSHFQGWMLTFGYAASKCIAPCLTVPDRMKHVNADVRRKLLHMTGFHFEATCEPFACKFIEEKGFCFDSELLKIANGDCGSRFLQRIRRSYNPPTSFPRFFDTSRTNVAVHVRVRNQFDNRDQDFDRDTAAAARVMESIRESNATSKPPLFHIFSQSEGYFLFNRTFSVPPREDERHWIDTDMLDTFDALVRADILIGAASALSIAASFLQTGVVYFSAYYHNYPTPPPHWIHYE